ncbi:MAG TPA: hypothetical protein VL400_23235 [Polyangiaceae bacterium]|jgi:His-Xaa-Ser system protein HxsD|nr:hypothetical protein [Polyangiaceae bacterium]
MHEEALELDLDLYPLDAIYAAAYAHLDRAYLFLERSGDLVKVRVRSKSATVTDREAAGQLANELLATSLRLLLTGERRRSVEAIVTRAIGGAAGPPGLDELLEADIGEATAFDDPLGIAMSWEEKYAKGKDPAKKDPANKDKG